MTRGVNKGGLMKPILKALGIFLGFTLAFHFVLMLHLTYRKVESIEVFLKHHIETDQFWKCEGVNEQKQRSTD